MKLVTRKQLIYTIEELQNRLKAYHKDILEGHQDLIAQYIINHHGYTYDIKEFIDENIGALIPINWSLRGEVYEAIQAYACILTPEAIKYLDLEEDIEVVIVYDDVHNEWFTSINGKDIEY